MVLQPRGDSRVLAACTPAASVAIIRGFSEELPSTWEPSLLVRHVMGLASVGRALLMDHRGTGLSGRTREAPSVGASMDDIRAVMDHARATPFVRALQV